MDGELYNRTGTHASAEGILSNKSQGIKPFTNVYMSFIF